MPILTLNLKIGDHNQKIVTNCFTFDLDATIALTKLFNDTCLLDEKGRDDYCKCRIYECHNGVHEKTLKNVFVYSVPSDTTKKIICCRTCFLKAMPLSKHMFNLIVATMKTAQSATGNLSRCRVDFVNGYSVIVH